MSTEIKCPNCSHTFPIEEVMAEEYKQDLREKMVSFTKQKEEEFQRKAEAFEQQRKQQEELYDKQKKQQELAFQQKLEQEKATLQATMAENLRKTISADFENQLRMSKEANLENEEKLKLARAKEIEFLKKEQEIKTREAELELSIQRKLQEQREELVAQVRKQELEKNSLKDTEHQLRVKELEKQLDDQKKLAEELTVMIHGAAEHKKAVFASQAFFKPTVDDLKLLDLKTLADVFQSLDQAEVTLAEIQAGYPIVDAFVKSGFLSSGNETRRALKENAVSVNKIKVTEEYVISTNDLIANTFVLLQKGKKNYYILKVV